MISPGIRVIPMLKKETRSATPKSMLAVVSFCIVTPLTLAQMLRFWGFVMISFVTIAGPKKFIPKSVRLEC